MKSSDDPVIAWWSGGITSAVACKLALDQYGIYNVIVVMIGTMNEDSDTYRFKVDCEKWYGVPIFEIKTKKYTDIQEIWYKYLSLNVAHGAICSTELKRQVREDFQKETAFSFQVFGFEKGEEKRAKAMSLNYAASNPVFPLIKNGLDKKDCIRIVEGAGLQVPNTYKYGFNNNNCFQTGCVQGGIGYWQKMQRDFPEKFDKMAFIEHDLTNIKGQPVTMLKDQSKGGGLVFLKPHPGYPGMKDISMMKGREPKPLTECNGFCGINDLSPKNETEKEINYSL